MIALLALEADPIVAGYEAVGEKAAQYGGLAVALILSGLLILLGIRYLRRALANAAPVGWVSYDMHDDPDWYEYEDGDGEHFDWDRWS